MEFEKFKLHSVKKNVKEWSSKNSNSTPLHLQMDRNLFFSNSTPLHFTTEWNSKNKTPIVCGLCYVAQAAQPLSLYFYFFNLKFKKKNLFFFILSQKKF